MDCTATTSQRLCQKQHIHAFPTIRVYRHKLIHAHENYLGDRSSEAFLAFIKESLPHTRHPPGAQLKGTAQVAGQHVHGGTADGEGCRLVGSVRISRVPGNLRISARSAEHSFNIAVSSACVATARMLLRRGMPPFGARCHT